MRAPALLAAFAVLATPAAALAQGAADAARPGMVVRSNVDRTLGKVERVETGADGRKVLVVVSYDEPPVRRAVPAERVTEVQGSSVRVDFGREGFDRLPPAR